MFSREKRTFSWRSLTPQLFLFFFLPLTVLLLILTFGGLYLHQQSMRTLVGERDLRAVHAAANALGEQIHHRQDAVRGLALRSFGDRDALAEVLSQSEFLQEDFDGGLAIYASGGERLASAGNPETWRSLDSLSQEQRLDLLMADRPVLFGDEGAYLFVSATSLDEKLITVGAFSPEHIASATLADVVASTQGGSAFMVSSSNQLVYTTGQVSDERLSSHPGVPEALSGASGADFINMRGSEHVIAYAPVPVVDWALVLEEPWETVASPLLRITENAPLVLIPIVILALLALWFATQRIVQPLQTLETKAWELAWGDFTAIEEPVGGISEIRNLQAELVHMAHRLRSAQESLKGYIGAMTQGMEEERRRLARELHDDTLQSLIALNQRVQLACMSLQGNDQAEKKLAEIQQLTELTIQDLRRLTRALRPIYLEDLGLVAALEMLAREVQLAQGIEVTFQVHGRERRLSASVELALYRMAQEAFSNISRHARASQSLLSIHFGQEDITLEVHDNGVGFLTPESPSELAPSGHFGLLGIYERAEMIGAQLEISSEPGNGARIRVQVPVKRHSEKV